MKRGTCSQCGFSGSVNSFYSFNGSTYCEPCVWKAAGQAKENGQPSEYVSLRDDTVCARCGADGGSIDYPLTGGHPFCPACSQLIYNWPYPPWMKKSLVCLLALLALSLVHERKYFRAGRSLYIGERLVEQGRYSDALPYLQQTLGVAPGSDKAALLTAKAALLIGDVEVAQKALNGHDNGHFEDADGQEFQEVDGLWKRAVGALEKAEQAEKLAQTEGQEAEAARLMHLAASSYPEAPGLAELAEYLDEGAAFERQDYETFLLIAQKQWKDYPSSRTAAAVASGLACKWAILGDPAYKQQAEEMLEKARQLATNGPDEQRALQDYTERIRYRLDSREIIGNNEYNRRFRSGAPQK